MNIDIVKNKSVKWLLILVAIFLIFIILIISGYFIFEKCYQNKIYPGARLGNIDLGGMTFEQAKKTINQKVDMINQNGTIFHYHNYQATLLPLISSVEGDLAYQLISFDLEKTINPIFNYGRDKNFKKNLWLKLNLIYNKKIFIAHYTINEAEIYDFLTSHFSSFETPAKSAKLTYSQNNYYGATNFHIEPEKYGQIIEYNKAIELLKKNLLMKFLSSHTDLQQNCYGYILNPQVG